MSSTFALRFSDGRPLHLLVNNRHDIVASQDAKILERNDKLTKAHVAKVSADAHLTTLLGARTTNASESNVRKAVARSERATHLYSKAVTGSLQAVGTGTGKVALLLPQDAITYQS